MASRPTVTGFFDDVAEAQQAVQLLLANGFVREVLRITTQTSPKQLPEASSTDLTQPGFKDEETDSDKSPSGHFLFSLFGHIEGIQPREANPDTISASESAEAILIRSPATVTVAVRTTAEAERAIELLCSAGAITD